MTKIEVTIKKGNIVKIEAIGHAGYSEGEDIVCSALSTVVQTAALGLLQVAKINAKIKRDDKLGLFSISVPGNLTEMQIHDAEVILQTALCGLTDLYEGYSKFIKLEVIKDVY